MTNTKWCPCCMQHKPVDEFHNNKATKDGKAAYCKFCLLARGAAYRQAHPDKVKITNRLSKQRNSDRVKATKKIYVDSNRDKINATKRLWNSNNPDKVHLMNQRSYARNRALFINNAAKRYAAYKNVEHRLVTRKDYMRLLNMSCVYCGSRKQIEIDHIQPIHKNGRHSIGNLAAACRKCNRSKSDLFVMQWRIRENKRRAV